MATSLQSKDAETSKDRTALISVKFDLFKSKKDYEHSKLSEIYSTFCALINSHGGVVNFELESGHIDKAKDLERRICQKFSGLLGIEDMRDAFDLISLSADEMTFEVHSMTQLCTLHYNMYIPTELQAVPLQSALEIKQILTPKGITDVTDNIKSEDYHKILVSGKPLSNTRADVSREIFLENKITQFKYLKDEDGSGKGNRATLGSRMISKENKFANYVSAFGNHRGGHIYFGVDDNGIVRGECIKDTADIIAKVSKAMNKTLWVSENDQFKPVKGQHWDIFFEPVKDDEGQPIEKMLVIVIYISYWIEGVFAKEPESYYIVDGKVLNMSFQEWKERVICSASRINPVARSGFRTTSSQKTYYENMQIMMNLRNQQGKEDKLKAFIDYVKTNNNTTDVELSTLSQEATCEFRSGKFDAANKTIQTYDRLSSESKDNMLIAKSMGLYIKSAMKRAEGKFQESFDLAIAGYQIAECLTLGLIQAWFCTHTALLANILANAESDEKRHHELVMLAKRLLGDALDYSNHVKTTSNQLIQAVADLQQKVYITLANLYLGLSLSGSLAPLAYVTEDDVSSAKNCLFMVGKLEKEGHKLSPMRKVQYLLALSALYHRQFQVFNDSVSQTLSVEKCEEATSLAVGNEFKELIRYCQQLKMSFEE